MVNFSLVSGAPVILTGQNMTGSSGTTLIIPCTVVGGSISRVFWTFQPSDQDNETEIIFSYSKFYWYSSSPSLRIYYLNTSDIGFYRCCANSSSGLGRSTPVYVTLRGRFFQKRSNYFKMFLIFPKVYDVYKINFLLINSML